VLKVNLTEAETCLAKLVKEAANGEEVIITQEDGSAFQLTCVTNVPSVLNADGDELYNPEGIWDQSVTSQDIDEARKEMWQKFDVKGSE
jgi:antitoxin (DNA-binding transcriptional repressor) of toxin-antitoxin stability system